MSPVLMYSTISLLVTGPTGCLRDRCSRRCNGRCSNRSRSGGGSGSSIGLGRSCLGSRRRGTGKNLGMLAGLGPVATVNRNFMCVVNLSRLGHLLEPRQRKRTHHTVVHFEEERLVGQHVLFFLSNNKHRTARLQRKDCITTFDASLSSSPNDFK